MAKLNDLSALASLLSSEEKEVLVEEEKKERAKKKIGDGKSAVLTLTLDIIPQFYFTTRRNFVELTLQTNKKCLANFK